MAKTSFPIVDGAGASVDMEAYESGTNELASAVVLEDATNVAISSSNPLPVALPVGTKTINQTSYDVQTASNQVLAANIGRLYMEFINASDTPIYLKIGGTAVVGEGIYLAASGGRWSMGDGWANALVSAIHGGTGSKRLLIIEVE